MRIHQALAASALACLLFPMAARAEFYPEFVSGSDMVPPKPAEQTVITDQAQLRKARHASGAKSHVVGIFELKPGALRHFDYDSPLMEEKDFITETVMVPTKGGVCPAVAASYRGALGRVVLGLGDIPADWDATVRRSALFSYWVDPHGKYKEVARHVVDSDGAAEAYVLDMTGTGVINVAIPWATGAGGGGGVDVIAVVPTGGLSGFGPNLDEFTLPAQTGGCELADIDVDGDWEIETTQPLFCNPCGFDVGQAWTYDLANYNWVEDEARFPGFYQPQHSFYAKLLLQVEVFMKNPASFEHKDLAADDEARYTCNIDGDDYSLWPFAPREDGNQDDAELWLKLLKDYVQGRNATL